MLAFHTAWKSSIFMTKNDKKLCTHSGQIIIVKHVIWRCITFIYSIVSGFGCMTKSLVIVALCCPFFSVFFVVMNACAVGFAKSHLLSNSIYVNWEIIHFNFHRIYAQKQKHNRKDCALWSHSHSHNAIASCLKWNLCKPGAQTGCCYFCFYSLFLEMVSTRKFIW